MLARHFPLEIFLNIKNCIALSDIRTHVCFYRTHPDIAALYDREEHPDRLWKRICWYSGIGALGKDDLDDPHCWRDIAIEVIEQDGFCKHPQCGSSLLAYSSRRMAGATKFVKPLTAYSGWRDEDPLWDMNEDVDSDGLFKRSPSLVMHRVMTRIGFRPHSSDMYYGLREDAQLRSHTEAEENYKGSVFLKAHPLLLRSFATNVPTARLRLSDVGPSVRTLKHAKIRRSSGVTVFDVIKAIYLELDKKLDLYDKDSLITHGLGLGGFLPQSWDDDTVYDEVDTLRDVLAVCYFEEMSFDGTVTDGYPYFCILLDSLDV
ncbi:hypothetical protein BN946_scf184805.g29 [Trametes cinnabarina]|uniref:Uncharacterized protein n=1 Tax=Pycnoporus cinnabarinus TaxID=5643 RepID=A0A060S3G3_PYCCI|nr:hypothetical protein BN946_scf184805.g29 [Trametes cinnabarina]